MDKGEKRGNTSKGMNLESFGRAKFWNSSCGIANEPVLREKDNHLV